MLCVVLSSPVFLFSSLLEAPFLFSFVLFSFFFFQSYAWFTSDGPKCPDAPDGCAAAQGCQDCVRSQACTFCVGSKTCVPIDMPNGGSSKCMNGGLVGHVEHDCDACRTHASCVDCQADQRKCFWCPHEQMCLAQGLEKIHLCVFLWFVWNGN